MCASFFGVEPASVMEVNFLICAPATDRDLESALSNWHKCQGQKIGELFLRGEVKRNPGGASQRY